MNKKLSILLRIFVSVGLLFLLFWLMRGQIDDIWGTIRSVDRRFIYLALCLFVINVSMLAYRMQLIFMGEDIYISVKEAIQLTFIGYFFNNFMPTAVGGDIIKAHYAGVHSKQRIKSYASVLMDRFIGLYSFLIVAGIALIVDQGRFQSAKLKPLIFSLILIGLGVFVVATNRRVASVVQRLLGRIKMMSLGEKLNSIYSIVHDYRNRGVLVVKSLAVSALAQSVFFMIIYFFFRALNDPVSVGNVFLIMPVVVFISMLPSVGGLGVREGAMVAFFAPLVGRETAFAASLLLLFGFFFVSFIGGVIYFIWHFRLSEIREAEKVMKEKM
jgi:hypothetical protein